MTDYGTTDTSTTTLAANQFPTNSVFIPGDTKLTSVGGANKLTDGNGKTYADVLVAIADGHNVTLGTSTDANTINSVMGRLTKIRDLLNTSIAVTQSGNWNITNITGTVSLPTGASTSAKQPALGTAGTASSDVLTVQGIASMTALKVDGSGFTQPVSGTFWQATQPVSGTVAAAQSGTWTVQPGNTANTTAWKVDGSAVNQPIIGTKTNNNAAPGATNIGALTGIANVAAPSYTEGDQVLISTDLAGNTRVTVANANANGQSTMANSAPVVIASDQASIPVKAATVALFTTTQTTQGTGNSGDLDVSKYRELTIDVNITATAGTNPTIQFEYDRKGADGIYYPIWFSDLINGLPANPTKISASIGAGLQWPEALGNTGRVVWTVGGTATPTYTFTPNVYGK